MKTDLDKNGDTSEDRLSKRRKKDIGKIPIRLNSITIVLIDPKNKNLRYIKQKYRDYLGIDPSDKDIRYIKQANNL